MSAYNVFLSILAVACLLSAASGETSTSKILFLVPGTTYRHVLIWESIAHNIQLVKNSTQRRVSCLIFVYDDERPPVNDANVDYVHKHCTMSTFYGGGYGDHIKAVNPFLIHDAGYEYVLMCLDDVTLIAFDADRVFSVMAKNRLELASPVIQGGAVGGMNMMHNESDGVGLLVEAVEVFVHVFTPNGWECFHDLINPKMNNRGLGYERFVQTWCDIYWMNKAIGMAPANFTFRRGAVLDKECLDYLAKYNEYQRTANHTFRMGIIFSAVASHRNHLSGGSTITPGSEKFQALFLSEFGSEASSPPEHAAISKDYMSSRFYTALRSPPCATLKNISVPDTKSLRQRQLMTYKMVHEGISIDCQAKLLAMFRASSQLPWREWHMIEGWWRHRVFEEARLANVRGTLE